MFDIDELVGECRAARDEAEPRGAMHEVLARALERRVEIAEALDPTEGGVTVLYNAPDLTVVNVVWAPGMAVVPHDHRMWAAIGIYGGREDNSFFRRTGPGRHAITPSGGRSLGEGDVLVLGADAVHSVANPERRLTGAIHVYGGDFVHDGRSQWPGDPDDEQPYDLEATQRQFEAANRAWREAEGGLSAT